MFHNNIDKKSRLPKVYRYIRFQILMKKMSITDNYFDATKYNLFYYALDFIQTTFSIYKKMKAYLKCVPNNNYYRIQYNSSAR